VNFFRSSCIVVAVVVGIGGHPISSAALPTVASINVCSDQLLLTLADPEQILSVSWLAADPEESMLAELAADFPLNYGEAEELIELDADVVLGGSLTNAPVRALLNRLGHDVVALNPANSLAEVERNIELVAAAIDRHDRGAALIAEMRSRAATIASRVQGQDTTAVVVRPGAFTVGSGSLADALMRLAGLRNIAAEQGLDRWGTLSLEALLMSRPQRLILTNYRDDEASLANSILAHPALAATRERVKVARVPAKLWACGLPQSLDAAELLAGLVETQ
jgi:iron complex transport system substrate-binding protein